MGFTHNCFIRKNNPELREKLEKLGYVCRGINIDDYPHIETKVDVLNKNHEFGSYYGCNNGEKDEMIDGIPLSLLAEGIDCDENEELFLAIAALRDDSDMFQYFIFDNSAYTDDIYVFWYKFGIYEDSDKMVYNVKNYDHRKATIDELIEHFTNLKNKKNDKNKR